MRTAAADRGPVLIAIGSGIGIAVHVLLRASHGSGPPAEIPLLATLMLGGGPLVLGLARRVVRLEFGSDLLAGISIVTAFLVGEYLAGSIVVLMLSGGTALEQYALRRASSVLEALARRVPSRAHRLRGTAIEETPVTAIVPGDVLVVYPHDICPVDGVVIDGRGRMNEAYLTGEPFEVVKTSGSAVISGAVNGESRLTIQATARAADSRYARIMQVMRDSEANRPRLRRLGDRLGAIYTPVALAIAGLAWVMSGDVTRALAVLVVATPCPLIIAIPVAIIGSISLCARRSIIVKSPVALEEIVRCRTALFDKTGTLTYGEPALSDVVPLSHFARQDVLGLAASIERYSRHPLAGAIVRAGALEGLPVSEADEVSERPGQGLRGVVGSRVVLITNRAALGMRGPEDLAGLPPPSTGLECVVVIDDVPAAVLRFHDAPRADSRPFIAHLGPKHQFRKTIIVSGDRRAEVDRLAEYVGVSEVYAQQTPEEKLAIVRRETALAETLYVGDGINDAPAMMAATVGMAVGQSSDITTEAAGVVVMDSSLSKIDEFLHIGRRMRAIALQSAIGGMSLSLAGMAIAATGALTPVEGAIGQEVIDVLAVVNALRAARTPKLIHHL